MSARTVAVSLTCLLSAACSLDALGLVDGDAGGGGGDGGGVAASSGSVAGSGGGASASTGVGGAGGAGGAQGAGGAGATTSTSSGTPSDPCTSVCVEAKSGGCNDVITGECATCCSNVKQVAANVQCGDEFEAYVGCLSAIVSGGSDICANDPCASERETLTSCLQGVCLPDGSQPNFACAPLIGCVDVMN
jgi:hypothetical protein